MSAPLLEFDLAGEVEQLRHEPECSSGQNAGRISIHTVQGHVRGRAQDQLCDLPVGTVLALDQGLPHDDEALEDSAILLTIAWPGPR